MDNTQKFDFSNRIFTIIVVLVAGVLVFFAGIVYYEFKAVDQGTDQFSVSGEGKVYATPDIATISLGMRNEGQDIKVLTKTNTDSVNKIISGLENLGVDKKDIQTTNYSVTPKYNWTQDKGNVPDGYTIEQNIQVKIRDFSKVGDVLTLATNDGANIVNGLQFSIDDQEKFKTEAREKAIAQAKAKADSITKSSGMKLGKLVNVSENFVMPYQPVAYNMMKATGMGVAESAPVSADVQAGQQEISVTVNLTYKVK
jgi:uncharacterized protein